MLYGKIIYNNSNNFLSTNFNFTNKPYKITILLLDNNLYASSLRSASRLLIKVRNLERGLFTKLIETLRQTIGWHFKCFKKRKTFINFDYWQKHLGVSIVDYNACANHSLMLLN